MQAEYPVTRLIFQLKRDNLLPAILFRTSRKQCDADIDRATRTQGAELSGEEQGVLQKEIQKVIEVYKLEPDIIYSHSQFDSLLRTGCGAHHAGQLLMWRLLLEELMSRGAMRLMIATGTVAAGVDFPARTVIITAHSKRGAEGFHVLTSTEFQQMSGRAGRRGKDAVGFCLVAPGPFSDARVIHEVAKRPPEPLRSAYFSSPSTILNLLKFRNVDDLEYTVSRSLAAFLDRKTASGMRKESEKLEEEVEAAKASNAKSSDSLKKEAKRARRKLKEAEEVEMRQLKNLRSTLDGLEKLGYVVGGALTEKGLWAAHLCTNLVLELGEAIADHLLDSLTVEELVGLVASIAGDPHRMYLSIRRNPIKEEYFDRLGELVQRVKDAFESPPNPDTVVVKEGAITAVSWLEAKDWMEFSALLRLGGVAEGDAARLIMQTAEHLGQICRLYETHPDLARTAAEARRGILKPPLSEPALVD